MVALVLFVSVAYHILNGQLRGAQVLIHLFLMLMCYVWHCKHDDSSAEQGQTCDTQTDTNIQHCVPLLPLCAPNAKQAKL